MGRLKRQKQHRKTLDFYRMQFHFQRPFKVLLDGNFLHHCIKNNINVRDRLATALSDNSVVPLVPDQVVEELTNIGLVCADALALASTFKRAPSHGRSPKKRKSAGSTTTTPTLTPTNHNDPDEVKLKVEDEDEDEDEDDMTSAADGILHLIGQHNRHRYIVATQDVNLRKQINQVPGVPVLYLNIGVTVIEQPSRSSREYQAVAEQKKLAPRKDERRRLQQRQQQESKARVALTQTQTGRDAELNLPGMQSVHAQPNKNKKKKWVQRGPKQPNPLSMRKKKRGSSSSTSSQQQQQQQQQQRKKKRRKKKGGGSVIPGECE